MTSPLAGKTLVIASHNPGKVKEIGALLAPLGIKAISATEAKVDEPEETGDTFAENAALKATHALMQSNLPALADDSGLVVPALGGSPGIYSARWAGPKKDFNVAFERIRSELLALDVGLDVPAYFVCMLCLALPGQQPRLFEGRIHGHLTFPPRGAKGFGYDPIFIPEGYTQSFAEISEDEKNRISHRSKAFALFLEFLKG